MAHNQYVRNGTVQRFDGGEYRGVFLYGLRVFDPVAAKRDFPNAVLSWNELGRPNEIVLHIAGVTYYPTRSGYVPV